MEERMMDDDPRLVKLKRTKEGETDVTEAGAEDAQTPEGAPAEETEEEVLFDVPEEEYDEDLVGLTPTQLKQELERRKRLEEEARAECLKLAEEGERALAEGDFEKAESFFAQAAVYPVSEVRVEKGLWIARSKNFSDLAPFFVQEHAEEFARGEEEARAFVLEQVAPALEAEREQIKREEAEVAPPVLEGQAERRAAFRANKKYYAVRVCAMLGGVLLFLIALAVSASYITTTLSVLPVALTGAFGGVAFLFLCAMLVFVRRYVIASKLCLANEELASTEEGARLKVLRDKLYCLALILGEEDAQE